MDEAERDDELARIRELADFVVERFGPISEIEFGFNRASVQWAEGFIERQRAALATRASRARCAPGDTASRSRAPGCRAASRPCPPPAAGSRRPRPAVAAPSAPARRARST